MARQIDPRQRVTEIIDDMGGTTEIAGLLDVTTAVVCMWRTRGDIPRRYWQAIIDLSHGRITSARLAGTEDWPS